MAYKRQEFEDEVTILSAENLNHIEDGILNASGDTIIPTLWESHMETKISSINTLNESLGSEADNFIFLADTHFPNNSGNSISLVKHIVENTSVKKIFLGGDIIEGNQGNATDMELLHSIRKEFSGLEIYPVRGNHDAHTSDITDSQWWDVFNRNLDYCETTKEMYYYHDNKTLKIRYIFADSVWGYGKYASDSYLISEEQLNWIKERMMELENDWTAIVVKHHLWDWNLLGELNKEGQKIVNSIDSYYDELKCTFVGIYAGHAHKDHSVTTEKGYILVTTIGDNNQVTSWKNGTLKEQAFDVVSLNPTTRTIKTIRIGQNGSDREIKY